MSQKFDVAIVGFGPVGAVAAALLGQAGLRVHVCDRMADVHEIPRAIALDHEILRVFQELGVATEVLMHCEPFTPSEYTGVDGQVIKRMTMVDPPFPQGYTPSMVFTQPPVERILRARVAALPQVEVSLESTLVGLTQNDEGVTLTLSDSSGQTCRVNADWVIGCDGGGSKVRSLLGIALEDLDFDEPWLVVDALVNERGLAKLPKTSVQYCEPERPCTFVIGPGNHRRWEISLKPGEDPTDAATAEGTWKLLSRWMSPDDGTLWRQSSYRFHALVAEQWRVGRVFLAGDAAHMQPPFLGQGMCQGIRDVKNLSWKLIDVLRGIATGDLAQGLLDSYGTERQGHVRELTSRLKQVGSVICERDIDTARARDTRLLAECGGVVKDQPRQDILPPLTAGLLSSQSSLGRGELFPQPRLVGGQLMDEYFGYGWRLVASGAPLPSSVPPGITTVCLAVGPHGDVGGILDAWLTRHSCVYALVRPDHYVFGTATTLSALNSLFAEWLQIFGDMAKHFDRQRVHFS